MLPFKIHLTKTMQIHTIHIVIISIFIGFVNSNSICKLPNTGTVLFRNIDAHQRHCWNVDELALLYTRRVMMELVPRQIPHNTPLILDFINICLTTLREQVTDKKVYDYMLASLVDTFGGYLQTYGLPLMHEAYYEGYVSYDNAAEFHRLQDNFKHILMTNGEGWTAAMEVRKQLNRILPLKIPSNVTTHPCSLLTKSSQQKPGDVSLIPLPILDDNKRPNSIAVPFKNHVLYNLKSRRSYDILIKFYIESSRCINQLHDKDKYQLEFDKAFSDWLKEKIFPHLKESVWFVGFSNVLRIMETIQQRGGLVGVAQVEEREDESVFSTFGSEFQFNKLTFITIFVTIVVFILLIGLFYSLLWRCSTMYAESTRGYYSHTDISDTSSLLDESGKLSSSSDGIGKQCPHRYQNPTPIPNGNVSQNRRTLSDESRLTLSRNLSRRFT